MKWSIIRALGTLTVLLLTMGACPASEQSSQNQLIAAAENAQGAPRVDALNALSKSYWGVSASEAREHAELAQVLARSIEYAAGEAAAWRNIGIAHWYEADYEAALAASLKAREIYQRIGDDRGEAGTISTIATILMNTERIDQAIALYREAIPIAERAGDRNRLGIIYSNLGTAHLGLEQPQAALDYLEQALPVLRSDGSDRDVLTCLANIGGAYRRLGQFDRSLAVNREVLELAQKIGNHERIAEAMADLGQASMGLGEMAQARNWFQRALDYSVEHELKRTEMTTLESMGTLLERLGDPAGALNAYKRHSALRAEAINAESAKAMADLQVRYETVQKEREIQIQRLQIERQQAQQLTLALLLVAALIGTAVILRLYQQKRRAVIELDLLSRTDPLTGVANRRAVRALTTQLDQAQRDVGHGVILFDIDHFKRINDRYGHDSGDHVLKGVATTLSAAVRSSDMVGRWGGEEFVIVAPNTDELALSGLAERCHRAVSAQDFVVNGKALRVTATAGWTRCGAEESFDSALKRADHALYKGKNAGRNRLVAA